MNEKQILVRAAQVVAFLFAISSGFLKKVAPPESSQFCVGLASLLALCIYLLLSVLSAKTLNRAAVRLWVIFGGAFAVIATASALIYFNNHERLTFFYPNDKPDGEYIAGTEYTPRAREFSQAHALVSSGEVLAKFGGLPNRHYVWTQESINRAQLILVVNYLIFTLSISTAVFCLLEIKAAQGRSPRVVAAAAPGARKARRSP
jgi:hypothetical protein